MYYIEKIEDSSGGEVFNEVSKKWEPEVLTYFVVMDSVTKREMDRFTNYSYAVSYIHSCN
jgi:hypothetical protein